MTLQLATNRRQWATCSRVLAMANPAEEVGNQAQGLWDKVMFWKDKKNIPGPAEVAEVVKEGPQEVKPWMRVFQRAERHVPPPIDVEDKLIRTGEEAAQVVEKKVSKGWRFFNRFWRKKSKQVEETSKKLEGIGEAVKEGDAETIQKKLKSPAF